MDPKLAALREQIPAVSTTGYFNAGTNGPLPKVAHDALVAAAATELDAGRIKPGVYEGNWARNAKVRELIADIFHADSLEIALTHSTSEGISAVLFGLTWQRGDEIVTSSLEHPGLLSPLALLSHRYGVIVRPVNVGDGGGDIVAAIAAALTPRTRMIAVSHVLWSTGAIAPIAELAELARERGLLIVVDGAQAVGQIPVDLHALDVDAYAMPGQKWLCGPEGTGALFVRADRLCDIQPTYIRYAQGDNAGFLLPAPGANRYEIGEFYGPAIFAQLAALRWLRDEVGFDWAAERTAALGQRCYDGLARLDGITLVTPESSKAGLIAFQTAGMRPQEMVAALFERGHTIRYVDYRPNPVIARVSAAWWTTEEEVDALIAAIGEIAASVDRPASGRSVAAR